MSLKLGLSRDEKAQERMAGTFIMAASFLIVIIVLTGTMKMMLLAAEGAFDSAESWETIGGIDYELIIPTQGYNITANNITQDPFDDAKKLDYEPDGWEYLTIRIVRNSSYERPWWAVDDWIVARNTNKWKQASLYSDFLLIHGKVDSHQKWLALPLSSLTDGERIADNKSIAYFSMLKANFTIIAQTAGTESDHSQMIDANNYNLKIAVNSLWLSLASGSLFTILGQIMTMQLPNTDAVTSWLLAVPFWAAMGFMVFTLISRMIPFIGGG